MVDSLTKEHRSHNMAAIKSKNTKPELSVRKFLHRIGFRYGLHRKDLPGKPDLVFPKYRAVIFVNGCYWHRHEGCKYAYQVKSNTEFWDAKFLENVERDNKNYSDLHDKGWSVIVVWECEVKNRSYERWLPERIRGNV